MVAQTRSARKPTGGADVDSTSNAPIAAQSATYSSAKPKAPALSTSSKSERIYRKTAPQPRQAHFPAPKKTVVSKTYGSKRHGSNRHSLPNPTTSTASTSSSNKTKGKKKDANQSTLTQIGWVPSTFPEDDDDMESMLVSLTGDTSDEEDKKVQRKRGRKRRKTTGDLELELEDEDGKVVPGSSFHTQTLTQMPSWRQSEDDEDVGLFAEHSDEEPGQGVESGGNTAAAAVGEEEDLYGATPQSNKRKRPSPGPETENPVEQQQSEPPPPPSATSSFIPQTPSKQHIERAEIPSSQPSPFTPNYNIQDRYWSPLNPQAQGIERTPLKEKSINVDAPTPRASGRAVRRTRSEIPDSWSTVNGGMGSSPARGSANRSRVIKRTPLKEIRFVDAVGDAGLELGERDPRILSEASPKDHGSPLQKSRRPDDEVIMNSDDESDVVDTPATPTPQARALGHNDERTIDATADIVSATELTEVNISEEVVTSTEMVPKIGTPRGHSPSAPRRSPLEERLQSEEVDAEEDEVPTPSLRETFHKQHSSGSGIQDSTIQESQFDTVEVDAEQDEPRSPCARKAAQQQHASDSAPHRWTTPQLPDAEDDIEPDTSSPSPHRRPSISSVADKETPLSSPQKTSPAMLPVSQLGYSYKSQAFESQRVPFEIIRQMAPQTDRSDVILSIHPEHVKQIAEGTRTHEFRDYRLPPTVRRIWIYNTAPVCELKYMAIISSAKQPGDIPAETPGTGNLEFNEGRGGKFAYELEQVYQLNNPVSLARMKENGWVEQAPARYEFVPPAVLGELMGNLRCALFMEDGEGPSSQLDISISQELEQQLRCDIVHSTQHIHMSSSQQRPRYDNSDQIVVPSSQEDIEEEEAHIENTPEPQQHKSTSARAAAAAFAKPTVPASRRSQRSVIHIDDSSPIRPSKSQQQQQQHHPRTVNPTPVRPSQATTASGYSQTQASPPQQQQQQQQEAHQRSIPLSPPTVPRPRLPHSSSIPSLPDELLVVDDSPVRMRYDDTSSLRNLGSSQALGLLGGEQDSLMDDSRIRLPPEDIVWDSEGDIMD